MSEDTLDKIDQLYPSAGLHRYYVVVTPEDIRPAITVPHAVFEKKGGKRPGEAFSVFKYPVPANVLFPCD